MILPKLAADYSAMLDGARNIKYDGRALATAGPAAAAAAGWSAGTYGGWRDVKRSWRPSALACVRIGAAPLLFALLLRRWEPAPMRIGLWGRGPPHG